VPKKLPKYGEDYKKIIFYDSDKRHADLKIRLQYDGLKQGEFFKAVMTAYLEKDGDFMKFLDRYKRDNETMDKTKMRKQEKIKKREKELKTKFSLEDNEIESIFDMLEEHSDL
tara:strand:- start:350 stop:688 length:339 start_codon:yes stop_codon:yes gene_type:complete